MTQGTQNEPVRQLSPLEDTWQGREQINSNLLESLIYIVCGQLLQLYYYNCDI